MQNRSANTGRTYNNNANRNVNNNVNNNANVNRNYNSNVDVNRNVNVNVNNNYHGGGCYNCGGYYNDNSWNWGSFAVGAALQRLLRFRQLHVLHRRLWWLLLRRSALYFNSAGRMRDSWRRWSGRLQLQQRLLPPLLSRYNAGLSGCNLSVGSDGDVIQGAHRGLTLKT
jgi:hypothetical protein